MATSLGSLDTTIALDRAGFPATDTRLIAGSVSDQADIRRKNLEEWCLRYWKPIYAFFRAHGRCSVEESRDLTQDIFCRLVEGDLLGGFDPGRGRFRPFLKEILRNHLIDRRREAGRLKRGGTRAHSSIDAGEVESAAFLADTRHLEPEDLFDRQWTLDLLARSVARLEAEFRSEGKPGMFEVYRAYDLVAAGRRKPTYAALARRFGLAEYDVTNQLRAVQLRLREILLDEVSRYAGGSEDLQREMKELFGP